MGKARLKGVSAKEGLCEQSTKKAFCRLIKGATLVTAPLPLGDDEMT
jgi:hypothetical protein